MARYNDLLARRFATLHTRRKFPDLQQPRQHRQLADQTLRDFQVEHLRYSLSDLVEIVNAKGETNPAHRAKKVDDDGILRPQSVVENYVLEVESLSTVRLFHHPVGNLTNLETRPHRLADARQLTGAVDRREELRYGIETHLSPAAVIGRSPT